MKRLQQHWLTTGRASATLAISADSLKRYANEFLVEGIHYQRGAHPNSPIRWNIEEIEDALYKRGRAVKQASK